MGTNCQELGSPEGVQPPLLIVEGPGGTPLDTLLNIQGPVGIAQFLRVAISVTAELGHLHRRGLVHKGIKPANILVDTSDDQAWLMRLGGTKGFAHAPQPPEPPQFAAGILPYMAPEQTGRMNRSIDSRSDLYSLGVTFYQMLTGTAPFTASGPTEWVHCHIAARPVPPNERSANVPDPISRIIMKLLAKTPEERYQTAGGVESDLRRCLADWERAGYIESFVVAQHDTAGRLLIPAKLYGRESEIDALHAAFNRVVASGRPELILISGYSGIGKSSIVAEFQKTLLPRRGLFASGKFEQYKRDIPYSTLAQAFQSLVRLLLGKSEQELSKWRDSLHESLGQSSGLMVSLVPELQLIMGESPPVPELAPQDAQRRFKLALRRFIQVFTSPARPLVLFLDDLQWLDSATLDLIQDLLTPSDVRHLMLIAAYRDKEVDSIHPLRARLDAIRTAGADVQEIALAPLTCQALAGLLRDSLHREAECTNALAGLIHEKTAGNPFFAIQFIMALVEEGLITFDHTERRWSWDLEHIRSKDYTDNVAELMVGKLSQLPIETLQALQLLACMGNSAEPALLERVSRQSSAAMQSRLREALRAGLIFGTEHSYRFLHDRVREAAYSLIPDDVRAETHLRIGRLLAADSPAEQHHGAIYEIVNQLNRGTALITSVEEREQLAELNLIAGKRAKAATAYGSALNYLHRGEALISCGRWPEDRRERGYPLLFAMEVIRAECEFLTGDLAVAEERLATLSWRAANLVDKATVACLRAALYTTLARADRAVEICVEYLREAGIVCSAHPTDEDVREEYARLQTQLDSRPIEAIFDLPLMDDPRWRATMEVLTELSAPAYFLDANLWCLVLLRMANLSAEHGNCDGSCYAYGFMNTVVGGRFGNHLAGFRFGQLSLDLIEKKGLHRFKARVYFAYGCAVIPWRRHIRAGVPLLHRGLEVALETGDQTYAAYAHCNLVANGLTSADPLEEVQRAAEAALEFAQQSRFGMMVDIVTGQLGFIRTVRGLTPQFGSFCDDCFDESRFEQHLEASPAFIACWYWVRKLQARVYAGDYAQAVAAAVKARARLQATSGLFEEADYHFYAALARAAASNSATPDERREHARALAEHHQRLAFWAENCAENFTSRAVLVGAEIARLDGQELEAERLYERAIRAAREQGFIQNEGLAYELAARFYAARGFEAFADLYLRSAWHCYQRWGAAGKVRQLIERYPRLKENQPASESRDTSGAPVEQLELATVLKVSQAVAGEIVLDRLLDRLMRAAIEHAGAERGLLIARRGHELEVQAQATANGADVIVNLTDSDHTETALPQSLVRYVMRTRDTVILDDASSENLFSADPYLVRHRSRSVLCLPLINQGNLIGVLYLENNLAPRVFAPARLAVLKLLASQAAMSLENTRLYRDLAKREAKIRRLVDANIVGIQIWDLDGTILEANDAFLRMVGYEREDLVSGRLRWTDLTPAQWRGRDRQDMVAQIQRSGSLQPFEWEYIRKDGGRVPALVGAATFEGENRGVGFVVDLTERKRSEHRLLVHLRITRILAEAATVEEAMPQILQAVCERPGWDLGVVWRIDRDAGVLRCVALWSKPTLQATQFEAATRTSVVRSGSGLPGRVWASRAPLLIPVIVEDPEFYHAQIAAQEGLHAACAFPILLGSEVLGVVAFISREAREGLVDLMLIVGGQIGQFMERKRAESALQLAQTEFAHATRVMTMGELTASIAHEVNQPLGAISASAGACERWLATDPPQIDKARRALERIVKDGRRASEVIQRIRAFMKRQAPQKEWLVINEAILEVIAIAQHQLRRNDILLGTQLAEGLPHVWGDRVQLQQVLLNLIVNGIEAMSGIDARRRELTIVSAADGPAAVAVEVRDSGVGLDPESAAHVFEPFYTTKSEGLGIGLSISRTIVEAHGGHLSVASNVPHGTVFRFSVPLEEPVS